MKKILFLILTVSLYACSGADKEAQDMLIEAKSLSDQGRFDDAEGMIDSIRKSYPRAVAQIKDGVALRKEVRIARNKKQIAVCDSLIPIALTKIDSLKSLFVFDQNKEYQTKGFFFPRNTPRTIVSTYFRSSVTEEGEVYLESIFLGGGKHDRVALSSGGETVESLPIRGDGLNYRFSSLGKQYEVLTIIPVNQNGMLDFVVKNANNPIKINLKGSGAVSYSLSQTQKKDIVLSYKLTQAILEKDSLISSRDKAALLLNYVTEQVEVTSDSE